jgi:hypothetical protein
VSVMLITFNCYIESATDSRLSAGAHRRNFEIRNRKLICVT